jgi:hypothetical protein
MTMMREGFAQLMAPGLHHTFVHWIDLKQREEEYTHLFHVETSDKAFEDEVEFAGLPPMIQKDEATSVQYNDAIQGGTVRYNMFTFALGVRSSFELYEDDQYGIIMQVPKALARSGHFTLEQRSANILNNGFSSTGTLTTDGLSLFNNQHPLLGGPGATNIGPGLTNVIGAAGTYPNRPSTDLDLSVTALQLMINQFERLVDSQGLPIVLKPKLIVIPPELQFIASEILGSAHKPYTADNEINALLSQDLNFFVGHYFTSQSAWFALCDKDQHQMKVFMRRKMDTKFSDDFDTLSVKEIAFWRGGFGATSWMGTWGSNGP